MIAAVFFTPLDWAVLIAYFAVILGLGQFFSRRNHSPDQLTAGGRSLSGWLCGMSILVTYLCSISYLALPGKAFVGNWNVFVLSRWKQMVWSDRGCQRRPAYRTDLSLLESGVGADARRWPAGAVF